MGRENISRSGIIFGLVWCVLAWAVFFTSYTGFLAELSSLPLIIGYWAAQNLIAPLSTGLAVYLNGFVFSVPLAVGLGWLLAVVAVRMISGFRRRVVFYRAKGQRQLTQRSYRYLRRNR